MVSLIESHGMSVVGFRYVFNGAIIISKASQE